MEKDESRARIWSQNLTEEIDLELRKGKLGWEIKKMLIEKNHDANVVSELIAKVQATRNEQNQDYQEIASGNVESGCLYLIGGGLLSILMGPIVFIGLISMGLLRLGLGIFQMTQKNK